jgi:hypothetical protein
VAADGGRRGKDDRKQNTINYKVRNTFHDEGCFTYIIQQTEMENYPQKLTERKIWFVRK